MNQQAVIKTVLDEFFGITKEVLNDSLTDEDGVAGGLTVDQVDTQILSEAIVQRLEKQNENSNQ